MDRKTTRLTAMILVHIVTSRRFFSSGGAETPNKYETTIFAIASGITKLSKVMFVVGPIWRVEIRLGCSTVSPLLLHGSALDPSELTVA